MSRIEHIRLQYRPFVHFQARHYGAVALQDDLVSVADFIAASAISKLVVCHPICPRRLPQMDSLSRFLARNAARPSPATDRCLRLGAFWLRGRACRNAARLFLRPLPSSNSARCISRCSRGLPFMATLGIQPITLKNKSPWSSCKICMKVWVLSTQHRPFYE
jgi:hypothetical protein